MVDSIESSDDDGRGDVENLDAVPELSEVRSSLSLQVPVDHHHEVDCECHEYQIDNDDEQSAGSYVPVQS